MVALPVVRHPDFEFSDVPRRWCDDDQLLTHVINGLSAVFPDGEKFFMRAVAAFESEADEELLQRIRAFYGQEASHGKAHRATFEMLEAQGYRIENWLAWYRAHAYRDGVESRVSPTTRLAVTVALEHFTATLAEVAFTPGELTDRMHPEMARLLRWHAAEEIEHKSVAFDLLSQVDPRWRTRAAGFVIGLLVLGLYASSAAHHLARQDGLRGARLRLAIELLRRPRVLRKGAAFLRPRFHPDEDDNYELAGRFLASFAN